MNNKGSTGIVSITILTSLLLTGAATSVMFDGTDDLSNDAKQIVNEVLDEITTYLKIDDVVGKYYINDGVRRVEKIVILVEQFIQSNIDISELNIKLSNNNDIILLKYSGHAYEIKTEAIFEHQIWDKTDHNFSLIVLNDKDKSLLDHGVMNKDKTFIAIKLPEDFAMNGGDSISLSLIPNKGTTRSIVLETPSFHSSNIISFMMI